jgi:hypothetical protein
VHLQHLLRVANTMEKFQTAVEPDQQSLHSQDSVGDVGPVAGAPWQMRKAFALTLCVPVVVEAS